MSHNADHSKEAVPNLPVMDDDVDAKAAIETMGLEERSVFRIGDCVYRYWGLDLGELIVDRLSEAAKTQTGRLPVSDVWYDYHRGNLEYGKWLREFVPADSSDESDSSTPNEESDEPTIEISSSTARTAHQELEILIQRTGGGEIGADEACSPLSLARQKVEDSDLLSDHERDHVLKIFHTVADERGEEISDADPLTDGTFRAEQELRAVLEA